MMYEAVHEMFRRTAERLGDRTAVQRESVQVTYRQLESRATEFAGILLDAGAEVGDLVAILGGETAEVIESMLGVLKAGCAFVPLDPKFPAATLSATVSEVQPRWWLVTPAYSHLFEQLRREHGFEATMIPMDAVGSDELAGARRPTRALPVAVAPDALCYVYFTSGSTGRPKGIAGRLKAIDHFVRWEIETFGIGEGTRVSQLTSPAFDAFLRDVFVPLVAGGTVCVPPSREVLLDGAKLTAWIEQQAVNLIHCTPSLFRSILAQGLQSTNFPALRHVLLAGEPLLPSDVAKWLGIFRDRIQLVNLYGPSETTMVKLFHIVTPEDAEGRSIPIGRPMAGARAIVVDEQGKPCLPGKVGEIYIRTPYRALGYLNRPDLTSEVFVQNPFGSQPDDLVYKTGDLGRLREDGSLEFIGRRDLQVKIRGVRVELGPIEDLLRSHEAVVDVALIDRTDSQGNKSLCAFLVLRHEFTTSRLVEFLREHLPDSMIPSAFRLMEALPRTLSGKVDRRALTDPGQAGSWLGTEYVAPRTPVEEELCKIFGELLGIPKVGIRDNFFEMGGHSLLATLLLSRIRAAFGVEVPLRQVFRTPSVEDLGLDVTRLQFEREGEEEMSILLRDIQGLSETEVERMIRDEAENG
jgi:amino acid adenylation domain-containing protein